MKKHLLLIIAGFILLSFSSCRNQSSSVIGGAMLSDLIKPNEGRSRRSSSTYTDEEGKPIDHNKDNIRVFPGESQVVLDAEGPGVVTHMWFTFYGPGSQVWAPEGSASHQEMLLRVFYDGSETPGVEVPVGDFFANCFGKRTEVISLPIMVEDGDSYNSYWPMPFRKSIKIEIVNQSKDKNINLLYWTIDWIELNRLPAKTPYFHALYRQEYPVTRKEGGSNDYVILETKGKGHYVGTVLAVRNRSPKWFGEGDEKIYIDDEKDPSIFGTGTEDYFLQAWGFRHKSNTPFFGTASFDQRGIGGRLSEYRWHIADPVVFTKSIKVTLESKGWLPPDENRERRSHSWNERQDDYSSVAYWYQTGTPTCDFNIPMAEERALPNLDRIVISAKGVVENKTYRYGKASWSKNAEHYMNGQLLFVPDNDQASVTIPFTVEAKEPCRLLLSMTQGPDYGIWQAYLNGIKVGRQMNLYSQETREWEHYLLDFWPEPGEYELTLKPVGTDRMSAGNSLGLEAVRLRERRPRVTEYAFDKDN
ncbi:MAG: DUF2961 domain-containing protein, partial [Bacteroidales bacterium]|nr:DUF2961 domain-containing protein [Bacteroidales bacterium]